VTVAPARVVGQTAVVVTSVAVARAAPNRDEAVTRLPGVSGPGSKEAEETFVNVVATAPPPTSVPRARL